MKTQCYGIMIFAAILAGCSGKPARKIASEEGGARLSAVSSPVTLSSGLVYTVLKEGSGDPIRPGQTAVVHYEGRLESGALFDASRPKGRPFSFILGKSLVIEGWHQGVRDMKKGETRKLRIPPNLAYGDRGIPGVIPPRATLIFDIELLDIQ